MVDRTVPTVLSPMPGVYSPVWGLGVTTSINALVAASRADALTLGVVVNANSLFGLIGDDSTDNTAAFVALIDALNITNYTYKIEPGNYRYNSTTFPRIIAIGGGIEGCGNNVTVLRDTATSGYAWKVGNDTGPVAAQEICFRGLRFTPVNIKTSGAEIANFGGSYRTRIIDVAFSFCYQPIYFSYSNSPMVDRCSFLYVYGPAGIWGKAVSLTYQTNAINITNLQANNPWWNTPNPSQSKTRSNTTAYSQYDYFVVNGHIWQVTTAGTTGTGTAQYVLPALTANLQDAITDGSAQVKWVSGSTTAWLLHDSYTYQMVAEKCQLVNGVHAAKMTDTLAAGDSFPIWLYLMRVECDRQYSNVVQLDAGRDFTAIGGWYASSLTASGIYEGSSAIGESIVMGSKLELNAKHGYQMDGASGRYTQIIGNRIGRNSELTSNTYNGVEVVANRAYFLVTNNIFGPTGTTTADSQHAAVNVNGATDTLFNVSDNIAHAQANGSTAAAAFLYGSAQSISIRRDNIAD